MTSSAIIDTAIGLILVFAIFSTAASRMNEWLASLLKLRFNTLVRGLENMLGDGTALNVTGLHALREGKKVVTGSTTLTQGVLTSNAVSRSSSNSPSYLSPKAVALGMLEVLETGGSVDKSLVKVEQAVNNVSPAQLQQLLQQFLQNAEGDRTKFIAELERWYQSTMDRVGGLYKRMVQWILIGITLIVVGLCNVDTIHIAETLYRNPAVRQIAVQQAATTTPQLCPLKGDGTTTTTAPGSGTTASAPVSADNTASCLVKKTQDLQLPLFWGTANRPSASGGWFLKILGLLVSVLALSFGATFWFDLLGNLVNMRNAGAKPSQATSPPPAAVQVTLVGASAPPGEPPIHDPAEPN